MSEIVKIPDCMRPDFVCIINGKEYSYPAGAEMEVPDAVACVIKNHMNHRADLMSGQSSSVNEALGTWKFVDEPDLSTLPTSGIAFILFDDALGNRGTEIRQGSSGSTSWGIYTLAFFAGTTNTAAYINNPTGSYGIAHGWQDESYKTITILAITDEPISREFVAWLKANATKIS